ncbi:MAG: WecB/TagA/CpsF family glycosyltransferase [Alphaproteobacteria bacterium]|nr:WecB/TagA/CpsF family glycosyltransferase [Alphaproteobacteria bacterium]
MVEDCRLARASGAAPKLVFATNGQALSLARTNPAIREAFEEADIVHADGAVIVAAANLLTRHRILERAATTDFIHDAAATAVRESLSFYLLGSTESVNAAATAELERRYPGLRIVGRRHGYFDAEEEAAICADITAAAPDVVWVGLGKPKEQLFCVRNRHRIRAGWLITCGGCFNFLSGDYRRAPVWMQRAGLEWLHRMFTGPRTLIWRYLTTNPHALYLIATRTGKRGAP